MPETITRRCGQFFAAMLIAASGAAALAADNPGAHQHGQAQLQLAIAADRIELIFTSPAYNLAGFEHKARTGEERQRLADVHDWLQSTPLITTVSGGCTVTASQVRLGREPGDHHDHGDHSPDHRNFEVTQQLICEAGAASGIFHSGLPARFPKLEELRIEWVGPADQGSTRVTSSAPTFSLNE